MYAIIQNGAHQYRIQPGQFIRLEKVDLAPGKVWKCQKVLALQDKQGQFMTGTPCIEKAEVKGRVIRHGKGKKQLVFKKHRRKGYRRTQGHRQEFTEVYIELINTPSGEKMEKKMSSAQKKDTKSLTSKQKDTSSVAEKNKEGK
jgi:large subunit ribosomal protein L21